MSLAFLEKNLHDALRRAGARANFEGPQQNQLEFRGLKVSKKLQNCLTEAVIKHVETSPQISRDIPQLIVESAKHLGFDFPTLSVDEDASLDILDYAHHTNFVSFFTFISDQVEFYFVSLRNC